MSLKTYINDEIQAFRKKATGDLNFGIQYGPTNAILGIHDAYPNVSVLNPTSIYLVKIGVTGAYDSATGLYNFTELERVPLPLTTITYNVSAGQYLVDKNIDILTTLDNCIYFIEFSNGTDTFKTEAFNANEYFNRILNPIPDQNDALFWLDGSILNDEFIDVSGNGRNFTINNKDFNDTWIKGFPFKTAATISAPIGDATLIAADVNEFLYTAGVPNEISVQSFYQNIDFNNTLLCRHTEQVLNAGLYEIAPSGVRDITLYNSVRTIDSIYTDFFGSEIVQPTVNVLFVSKLGNDTTGTGTFLLPYLTIDKAIQTGINGDSIYVLGGTYTEDSAGVGHLNYDRNGVELNITGISSVVINSTLGTYNVEKEDGTINWTNIIFDGTGRGTNFLNQFDSSSIQKCIFLGSPVNYNKWGGAISSIIKSAAIDSGGIRIIDDSDIYTENYAENIDQAAGDVVVKYNKFVFEGASRYYCNGSGNRGLTFQYNDVFHEATGVFVNAIDSTNPYILNVTKNNFYLSGVSILATYSIYVAAQDVTPTSNFTPTINNNKFYDNSNNARTFAFIRITSSLIENPVIEYNQFESITTERRNHISIDPTFSPNAGSVKIRYNRFITNSFEGATLDFTEANIPSVFDESEIIGNYFRGYLYANPTDLLASCHGMLVSNGKNMIIQYNRVEYFPLGIVVKSQGEAYTKNGVLYNSCYNNRAHFYYRRTSFLNTYGNTFANSSVIALARFGAIDEQGAANLAQGFVFSNNIFSTVLSSLTSNPAFTIAANGLIGANPVDFNTNIFNEINTTSFIIDDGVPTSYTYAQSVTNGWVNNGKQDIPLFNNLNAGQIWLTALSPGIGEGLNLGATYIDALDVSTDYGDSDTLPVIVTKAQSVPWDMGAYVI